MSTVTVPNAANASILQYSYGDDVQKYVIAAFAGVVWYNAIELVILCLFTFKRYQGCYFWSLLVSSSCLIPHVLGYIFFIFPIGITPYVSVTLILVPWCGMVTGHSLVLWSRLHLVLQTPKVLWGVLCMIIINATIFHTSIFVLMYGMVSPLSHRFIRGYDIMEHIQLVGFCIQELILSGIYVWETTKMLRLRPEHRRKQILLLLLVINIFILILDVAILGTEFAGYYAVQVMFKPVTYSIKLKLEYAILGKLIEISSGPSQVPCPSESGREGIWSGNSTQLGSGGGFSDTMREIDSVSKADESYR